MDTQSPPHTLLRSTELRRIQLRSRRLVTGDLLGQYRSAFRGTGLVYTEIREYQPGDDVKHIHWKATARTSKVFVKSYEEDRQLRVLLAVDVSASMRAVNQHSASSKALEFVATVGALSQRGNDLLGLSLFADQPLSFLQPKAGSKRTQQILASLMSAKGEYKGTDVGKALSHISLSLRKPSIIFVVSDFFGPPFEQELKTLSAVHDVVLVQIDSPLEPVENIGLITYTDAESGGHVVIDTSSLTVRERWRVAVETRRKEIRDTAQACRADHIVISDSVVRPLVQLMRERTRRISR